MFFWLVGGLQRTLTGIKKDNFCYHLGRWRKKNTNNPATPSFLPIELPQDKWKLYFGQDLYLELPNDITIEQLLAFVSLFRKTAC